MQAPEHLQGFTEACQVALSLCLEQQLLALTAAEPALVAELQRTLLDMLAVAAALPRGLSRRQLSNLLNLANLVCGAFGNEQLGSWEAVGPEQSVLDRLQTVQLVCRCLGWAMQREEHAGSCESLW